MKVEANRNYIFGNARTGYGGLEHSLHFQCQWENVAVFLFVYLFFCTARRLEGMLHVVR